MWRRKNKLKMGGNNKNKELIEKIYDFCDRLGFWNVHPVQMAKQLSKECDYEIPHQNISRWKKNYINKHGIPDIEKVGKELNVNSQAALKEIIKLMKSGSDSIKVQAVRTFFESQEKFTKFLENFKYKEKVAEKLDIGGVEFNVTGIKDNYPDVEVKNDKKPKPSKKTKTKVS